MGTTSNKKKKSTLPRASSVREKARSAVTGRVSHSVARRLPKPRTGFEALVAPLAALVAQHPAEFATGIDVELMLSSLATYRALEVDYIAAVKHLACIESMRLVSSSTVWTQVLAIYDRGRSLARFDDDVQAQIDPVEDFMKTGPRKRRVSATAP